MAIYLLRHGLSEGNAQRIFQGRLDTALTEAGRDQARIAGRWLNQQGVRPAAIYSSPLSRALDTARILSEQLGSAEPQQCPELLEFDAGSLEGMTVSAVEEHYPEHCHRELGNRGDFTKYGGESYEQIQDRLKSFIARFLPPEDYGDVLIVSHGGTLYQLLKLWCGWPVPRHFFTHIGNCTCYKLQLREFADHTAMELQWMVPVELMEAAGGSAA